MRMVSFFVFVLAGNCGLLFGATNPGDPFDCSGGRRPPAAQLETVARFALSDAEESSGKYRGMDLFVETRDRTTKRYLWFANIKFHSKGKAPGSLGLTESCVTVKYCTSNGFFGDELPYSIERVPIRFFHVDRNSTDPSAGDQTRDRYQYFLQRSILEFTLVNILELRRLYEHISEMKEEMKGYFQNWIELPKYSVTGYAHKEKTWNCAVFSAALLQRLGVNLCECSDTLRGFIRFEYGHLKGWAAIGATIGGITGGVGGFFAGGVVTFGTLSAPAAYAGAAGGAAAGAALFGGSKAVGDLVYDRAFPWVILDEVINNHSGLNIRPRFLVPTGNHVLKALDTVYVTRRSLIENNPDKYDEWYKLFIGANASLNTFVVRYPFN